MEDGKSLALSDLSKNVLISMSIVLTTTAFGELDNNEILEIIGKVNDP